MRWSVILPPGDSAKSPSSRPSPTSRQWNCGTGATSARWRKRDCTPRLYGEVAYAGYRQHVCDTLDRILAMVPDTDGFFFTTHILATEALRYFHDRGIDISDGRLGLACMHEDPLFRLAAPRMSVARFPVEEISAHAVRLLLRQIRESQSPGSVRPAPESVVLPCRMEFRDE